MKTINFKRTDSAIRVWDDDPKSRKNINWDRLIYLILLTLVLFFGVRYLINNFLYVNATGHILFEKRNIRNVDDCQLLKFYILEGDSIRAGDTLFSYLEDDDENGNGLNIGSANSSPVSVAMSQGGKDNNDWVEKEMYNLRKNISANRVRIAENQKLLELYKEQRRKIKQQVMLDLTPRNKLDELDEDIKTTDFEIERLNAEINEASAFMNKLGTMRTTDGAGQQMKVNAGQNKLSAGNGENNLTRYYLSPIDGTITKINFQSMEVALKSEIILSIHKPEHIYVKVFFDQSDLKDVKIGDEVNVEFPDGTVSVGKIQRFYYATNALPEEFQKKYEPVTRTLLADVVPLNDEELKKWKTFYRMGVKITKYKY